jgi:hypothetical protein
MPDLQYGTFIDAALTALPEARQRYAALQDELGGSALPHIVVGLILEPTAKQALDEADGSLLRRIFAFFEEMACSQDVQVRNLLYVEVFEAWVAERETLSRAWKYMGECTKNMASDAAHRLNRGNDLPRR